MLHVLLIVHLGIILGNNQLDVQFFFLICLFQFSTCFEQTSCSSSGESVVSVQRLVHVTLCRWPSGMQVGKEIHFLFDLHTRRSPTQSDIHQTLYWYNWFSWRWARGCSKHVQDWNKYIRKKRIVRQFGYLLEQAQCFIDYKLSKEG
jgi:hypothetical protein